MADAITIKALQDASLDAKSLEEVVNGDEAKQVTTRLGETYPSVKKAITDLFQNGGLPATPFATKALMTASALVDNDYAMVTEDTPNNGLYVKTAGAWVKSVYDPVTQTKSIIDSEVDEANRHGLVVRLYTSEEFNQPAHISTYSETKLINVRGMRAGFIRAQYIDSITTVVHGFRADGSTVVLVTTSSFGEIFTRFDIPTDVQEIKVRCANATHADYNPNFAPFVAVGTNISIVEERVKTFLKSSTSYIGFPVLNKNVLTSNTTYDTTLRIQLVKGMAVSYNVMALGVVVVFVDGLTTTRITSLAQTFIAPQDGNLRISTYNSTHANYDASFKPAYNVIYDITQQSLAKNRQYLPTLTLKATRDIHFLDGSDPKTVQYLWHDELSNFYMSETKTGEKTFIFNFVSSVFHDERPRDFSMNFDKYGNVICVYRTEHKATGFSESIRKNPIIMIKDNNYAPTVIDFGEDLKPSGWMQNSGFLCTDDAIYIAEYTRPSVETANTWKATYPLTNAQNWSVVQSFDLTPAGQEERAVKHLHNVQRDPYTGHIYTSTGDNDAGSAIYVSTDTGDTFSSIVTGSEKYGRTINFVFTKNWIYWATDSYGAKHWFFKAPRNESGVLDADNIVDMQLFPTDSPPTYATIHFRNINALLFLGREDVPKASTAIDLWDLSNDTMHRLDVLPSVDGKVLETGFRCECFEYYPRENSTICGFSNKLAQGGYPNYNGILGNSEKEHSRVNNLIITVERIGDEFTITYDTAL